MQMNPHVSEETIKKHEDNLKFLITQKNQLDEAVLDLQGVPLLALCFEIDNIK